MEHLNHFDETLAVDVVQGAKGGKQPGKSEQWNHLRECGIFVYADSKWFDNEKLLFNAAWMRAHFAQVLPFRVSRDPARRATGRVAGARPAILWRVPQCFRTP